MHHFAIALCAGVVATAVVGGTALRPTPAEAARTPSAEAVALKDATAACKAEAKEKKIRWPASRKFVSDCVAKTVKLTPAELQKTAVKQATVCLQGGGEGQKDQVASDPEVRQKLHHNGPQRASHNAHQRIAQRGECKDFAGAATHGMGMRGLYAGRATGC
jgi:hypothetical protein